jgi:hypothetical protein
MTEARTCRGADRGLSRPTVARWRGCLETLGLGPVRILPHPQGCGDRRILEVRIGPWRRLVASEADFRALIEERQACYF